MKLTLSLSLLGVLIFATAAEAQTTVLRDARVIDGTGGAPLDNATIVIRDGRIVSVGPSANTPVPDGAEIVDYRGKTTSLVSSPRTRMSESLLGSRLPRRTTIASPFCGN